MKVKLNYDCLTYKKDSIIEIDKLPFKEQQYFNRRLKDAKIDKCVEIVKEKTKTKEEKKEETKDK